MATADMTGLFGPTPYQIQQAQQQALQTQAAAYADQTPLQRAAQGMFTAGGQAMGAVAPAMGMVNPQAQLAQQTQDLQSGIDHTTSDGLLAGAAKLKDVNPGLAAKYVQAAQGMKMQESTIAYQGSEANEKNAKSKLDVALATKAQALADKAQRDQAMANLPPVVQAIHYRSKLDPNDPDYMKNMDDLNTYIENNIGEKVTKDSSDIQLIKATAKAKGLVEGTPAFNDFVAKSGAGLLDKKTHINVNVSGAATTSPLSENAQRVYDDLVISGKLPAGYRGQALADRNAFLEREGEKRYGAGGTGLSASADQAGAKANVAALNKNTGAIAAIEPFANMLDQNIDILKGLAQKAVPTGSKFANKTVNWIRQNAGDNPDTADMLAQMLFVQTEAARVIANPNLVGAITNSARAELQHVVDGDMPIDSMVRVLDRIKNDGHRRISELKITNEKLKGTIGDTKPTPATKPTRIKFDANGNMVQ